MIVLAMPDERGVVDGDRARLFCFARLQDGHAISIQQPRRPRDPGLRTLDRRPDLGFGVGLEEFAGEELSVREEGRQVGGARTVDLMNYNSDIDLFAGYAEAELSGTFSQDVTRAYYVANVFKRAEGQGRSDPSGGGHGRAQKSVEDGTGHDH